jgi:hypothetical protein
MKKALAACLLASTLAAESVGRADEERARVHIKSETHVQLESRSSSADAWALACDSPCDRELPLGDEYRMVYGAPAAQNRGDTFRLSALPGGSVTLTFDSGSTVQFVGGVAIAVGGVALAVAGVAGFAAASRSSSSDSSVKTAECSICGGGLGGLVEFVSVVALVAGGGALLTGVLLVNDAGPSTTQKPVFAREPTWLGPRAAGPDKRALIVPLSFAF